MSSRLSLLGVAAVTVALAVVAGGGQPVLARGSAAVAPGPASVKLLECSTGKLPADRFAVFRAEMSQVPAAEGMRMRFWLAEKVGTTRSWRTLIVDPWHYSKPGIQRFAYEQRVNRLKPATRYRMEVVFHWLDSDGGVIARASGRAKICRQRGKLPNFGIRDDVAMREGPTPGTYRYAVRIHNNGPARSPRSELRLLVDGAEVDVRPFGRLRSGERRMIRFVGPACKGDVRAEIDPAGVVREITEKDNARNTSCSVAP